MLRQHWPRLDYRLRLISIQILQRRCHFLYRRQRQLLYCVCYRPLLYTRLVRRLLTTYLFLFSFIDLLELLRIEHTEVIVEHSKRIDVSFCMSYNLSYKDLFTHVEREGGDLWTFIFSSYCERSRWVHLLQPAVEDSIVLSNFFDFVNTSYYLQIICSIYKRCK